MKVAVKDLRELALSAAAGAGQLLTEYRSRGLTIRSKSSHTDPVSEADESAERSILDTILAVRPDDGFLGEEDQANRPGTTGLRWVVDPLDGTVNYVYGIPLWCVSIACEDSDGAVVGVVHHPGAGETFVAARGLGAHRFGPDEFEQELSVSTPPDLGRTLLATGFAYDAVTRAGQGRMAAAMLSHVRDLRRGGAAALDLAWTAAGRVDAYLEHGLKPWDWAAGALLVREAGGRVERLLHDFGSGPKQGMIAGGDATVGWLQALVASGQLEHGLDTELT